MSFFKSGPSAPAPPAQPAAKNASKERAPIGGYSFLPKTPNDVARVSGAMVDFRRMNIDTFPCDPLVTRSSLHSRNVVDVRDMLSVRKNENGEVSSLAHPGGEPGILTIAMQSVQNARCSDLQVFSPAVHSAPNRFGAKRDVYGLVEIAVYGLWPYGTDGRLFYLQECFIRKASPAIRRRIFARAGIEFQGDVYVVASLPGSDYGSPIILPRHLSEEDIELSCYSWSGRSVVDGLKDALAYARTLEDSLEQLDSNKAARTDSLSRAALWTWLEAAKREDASKECHKQARAIIDFCQIDCKREKAHILRYERGQSGNENDVGYLENGFIRYWEGEGYRDKNGTVPPYFVFESSPKVRGGAQIAVRPQQLRLWLLFSYVHGLSSIYNCVVPCNTIRPPTTLLGGKCRVRVPSRFLMSLGLCELQALWAVVYSPISVARAIRDASGDTEAGESDEIINNHDSRSLESVFPYIIRLDKEHALELSAAERIPLPWQLHLRNILYALLRLSVSDEDCSTDPEASLRFDSEAAFSTPFVAVPFQAFYALQARQVIDTVFAKTELSMLSCAPPLNSTTLHYLELIHRDTRCIWTCAFGRVAVVRMLPSGESPVLSAEESGAYVSDLFPSRVVELYGPRLVSHFLKTARFAVVPRNTPLAASAFYDFVVAPNGSPETSFSAADALYQLQARSALLESQLLRRLAGFVRFDNDRQESTRRVIESFAKSLGLGRIPQSVLVGISSFVAPSVCIPHRFAPGVHSVLPAETRSLADQCLPGMLAQDAFSTSARISNNALASVFIPPEREIKSVEYSTTGSTGIYASAAVRAMETKMQSIFGGRWDSVGSLLGGKKDFWRAVNWLIAIGAVVAITATPDAYVESRIDIHPPYQPHAQGWRLSACAGVSSPGSFDFSTDLVELTALFPQVEASEAVEPKNAEEDVLSESKPAAAMDLVSDSDSDSEFDFSKLSCIAESSVDPREEMRNLANALGNANVQPELPPPSLCDSDFDVIICPSDAAACSKLIAQKLHNLEILCGSNTDELSGRVRYRADYFIKNGEFPKDPLTDAFMEKRIRMRSEIIKSKVVPAADFEAWVERPDSDFKIKLAPQQEEALESLIDDSNPRIRVLVGRAGTGKSALILALVFSFGIIDMSQVLVLANMNVNVQDWKRNLGMNGRVSTIASFLMNPENVFTSWLKKHTSYVQKRSSEGPWNEYKGGREEFIHTMEDMPIGKCGPEHVTVVCIEEAGNVSDKLMANLLIALEMFPNLQRIIFFGDTDQLDPVEVGTPYAALVQDHKKRGLLLKLEEVHHTKNPMLGHTALTVTNGASSPEFNRYVESKCTATGPGITSKISTNPKNFVCPPIVHFDKGLTAKTLDRNVVHGTSKVVEDEFRALVLQTMRDLHSENVACLAFRHVEAKLLSDALRVLRSDSASARFPNGLLPKLISGDFATPVTSVCGGRISKNTPLVVLGFLKLVPSDIQSGRKKNIQAGTSVLVKHGSRYTRSFSQASHQGGNTGAGTKCVVVVPRAEFFEAMSELVALIAKKEVRPSSVFSKTNLADKVKYENGDFVPSFSDLDKLRKWPTAEEPFMSIYDRKFGSANLSVIAYSSDKWELGYSFTGAAVQGSRFEKVVIGIFRPSPFFTWRLLNVMLTRARESVTIVSAFRDVRSFVVEQVIKKRGIKRTNVLPTFLERERKRNLRVETATGIQSIEPLTQNDDLYADAPTDGAMNSLFKKRLRDPNEPLQAIQDNSAKRARNLL